MLIFKVILWSRWYKYCRHIIIRKHWPQRGEVIVQGSKLVLSVGGLNLNKLCFTFLSVLCHTVFLNCSDRLTELWKYLNRVCLFVCFVFLLGSSFLSYFPLQLKKKKRRQVFITPLEPDFGSNRLCFELRRSLVFPAHLSFQHCLADWV